MYQANKMNAAQKNIKQTINTKLKQQQNELNKGQDRIFNLIEGNVLTTGGTLNLAMANWLS
jgi:hypothetical protein